ncbi:MAG: AAA family ATPase [Clostridia bacterium]|nr:AAA family ATPase [Clostridia bacterium]
MEIFGLIGKNLSHSRSPQIHALLGDYEYRLFELDEDKVGPFLTRREFSAVNVTIPYKKTVMPFLDRTDDLARKIGSVNTVIKEEDGSLTGYNTDYYGFSAMLKNAGISLDGKRVLILGSGGASAAASAAARDSEAACVTVVSRSGHPNYGELSPYSDTEILINSTPVGMYPNNLVSPVDIDMFPRLEAVVDMIYNPARTLLVMNARERNIRTVTGLYMLVAQGKRAAELFFKKPIPEDERIDQAFGRLSRDMQNIVLIGMPGSGKTTVGKALARSLGRDFVDTDEMITFRTGMSIPEFFAKYGEERFREVESEAAREAGKQNGCVISAGGGIVTKKENYYALKQNGVIFWLKRDLSLLPTDGRPLSQSNDIKKLYKAREPLYKGFADHEVRNSARIEDTVNMITALSGYR